jgi:competence protein ComEC
LEKPKLFPDEKSFIVAMLFLLCLLLFRLGFTYYSYKDFISKPFYYTYAQVIYAYQKSKSDRVYQVLKLRSDEGLDFYTTTHTKKDFTHKRLRMQIFPNENITFWEYLGTFYIKSNIKEEELLPATLKDDLLKKVAMQHEDPLLQSFYNAIFFATPLDKELREKIR